jgi:hypothetical protein
MRVFAPVTVDQLTALDADGGLTDPIAGYAVTARLRQQLGDLDEEEVEFAVTTAAAEAAYDSLTDAGVSSGRRIVVVAEVADEDATEDNESPGLVTVQPGLLRRQLAAVLADPAELVLAEASAAELGWYGAQEISILLR